MPSSPPVAFGVLLLAAVAAGSSCNRTVLNICLSKTSVFLDHPLLRGGGLPHTNETVQAACRAFKAGMNCIDQQSRSCLSKRMRDEWEQRIQGARYVFQFLCDDPVFQSTYLQHTDCYRETSQDWLHCQVIFERLVAYEMQLPNATDEDRNLALCCAKHGFMRCVSSASNFKCRKESTLFLMRVAQTLTEVQVHEEGCQIDFDAVCIGSGGGGVATLPPGSAAWWWCWWWAPLWAGLLQRIGK